MVNIFVLKILNKIKYAHVYAVKFRHKKNKRTKNIFYYGFFIKQSYSKCNKLINT